jgi:mannose-1-phosphate guanylyltransferase
MKYVDAVVVLGYPLHSKSDVLQKRLKRALNFANKYDVDTVIASGKGRLNNNESSYMVHWLRGHHYTGKIIQESRSRDTIENILFSGQICQQSNFQSVVIVTSWFHVLRTWIITRQVMHYATVIASPGGSIALLCKDLSLIIPTECRLQRLLTQKQTRKG